MEKKIAIRIMILLTAVMSLAACTAEQEDEHIAMLTVYPGSQATVSISTRAVPGGYSRLTNTNTTLGLFLVHLTDEDSDGNRETTTIEGPKNFTYNSTKLGWRCGVTIEPDVDYQIYGISPYKSTATLTQETTSPTIVIPGLNVTGNEDVCVIVGVGEGNTDPIDTSVHSVSVGTFGYHTKATTVDNIVYVLMNHICSQLDINYSLGTKYAELRQIKIRQVNIAPSENTTYTTYKATVTVTPNTNGNDPISVSFEGTGNTSSQTSTLYDKTGDGEGDFLTSTPVNISGFLVPTTVTSITDYVLTTTYDVYDLKGQLLRGGCQATNKLKLSDNLPMGSKYTIDATIEPTYLYQLSDYDLNNPGITIN